MQKIVKVGHEASRRERNKYKIAVQKYLGKHPSCLRKTRFDVKIKMDLSRSYGGSLGRSGLNETGLGLCFHG
jgi:hypothetical protein